jgi:protein ImuA
MPARTQIIADLRASIEGIEKRSALAERKGAAGVAAEGVPQIGAGTLSEVFADATRDAGAALGFCLFEAQGLVTSERPAVLFLQMRAEAQETGLPYGPGLACFGFDPDALAVVRTDTIGEMLWAMEEAAGCRNVAAVIGDFARSHKGLDFTASRRLGMRAETFGVALMLMRYGQERMASAATFRWHIAPAPSAAEAFDQRAPGAMRYRATLEKGARRFASGDAARHHAGGEDSWVLKWTEHGLAADIPGKRDGSGTNGRAALSVAHPAGLGDRLPQTA